MATRDVRVAQGLRRFQQEHPFLDTGISMVPFVGQGYGLAQSAAAMRDPEASTADKAMAAASVLPVGKVADKLRKIVVGEKTIKGHPALEDSLKRAKEMLAKAWRDEGPVSKGPKNVKELALGDPRLQDRIHKETGFWVDPDSKRWMTELDDSRAIPDYQFMDQATQNKVPMSLGDALPHPELAKMPEGRRVLEEVGIRQDVSHGRGGLYQPSEDTIEYGRLEPDPKSMRDVRDTVLHEGQHAIAAREGYKRGTNPEAAGSYKEYLKDPGEILARVTSLRRNMTPEARRKYPFHRMVEEERTRLMDPLQNSYAKEADLKRALMLRNLDPEEMLVPGP